MTSAHLKDALRPTPQSQPLDERQVENSAGGYVYEASPAQRLRRFLILGSEGGSYYATERELTSEQVSQLRALVTAAGPETVETIVEVSERGLAPKNDQAIFALALASVIGDESTRELANDAVPRVCRTGTHLFAYVDYRDSMASWGQGAMRGVRAWYENKTPEQLALQLVKYQQRGGWSHRDVLRTAHPNAPTPAHRRLYDFACGRDPYGDGPYEEAESLILGFEQARMEGASAAAVIESIERYRLPREAVPTQFLNEPRVWEALLGHMPAHALIRNLGKMSSVGLLQAGSAASARVVELLGDREYLTRARVHPVNVLAALLTYQQGHGYRGSLKWHPVPQVVDALDAAFYLAFGAVEPANKRHLLSIDVSGSMRFNHCAGLETLSANMGAAAMALVAANTEPAYDVMGFAWEYRPLPVTARSRLHDAARACQDHAFGATDCALPMQWALRERREFDVFVIYSDMESWVGEQHAMDALREYRQRMGIDAKLICVSMVGNRFSLADPNDGGALDVVGFDSSAPSLMSVFARGEL